MENPALPIAEAIIEDLITNPRYQKFYEGYSPSSIKSFAQRYADQKLFYLQHVRAHDEQHEKADLRLQTKAAEHLLVIQRKKLFDVECLWNANHLKLAEIETSDEFSCWYDDLYFCPFITPISRDEVRLYIQFLRLHREQAPTDYYNWSDLYDYHHKFRKGEDDEPRMPEYYLFHNEQTGNGRYLELKDTRREKETYYRRLSYEARREELAARREPEAKKEAAMATMDNRPALAYYNETVIKNFVRQFENYEMQCWSEAWEKAYVDRTSRKYEFMVMISDLLACGDSIPVVRTMPVEDALEQADQVRQTKKLIAAMPQAYDEYLLKLEMELHVRPDEDMMEVRDEIAAQSKACIVEGRKLAGEPENLDF